MSNLDLMDFIAESSQKIENEYKRIQRNIISDPGNGGAQGEKNWAELLQSWLPKTFHVVTGGRIMDSTGALSRQIDVIVLKPEYPPALINTNLYLAGGVLAVFECKTTLKPADIAAFFETTAIIKNLAPLKSHRNIYEETHSHIYVGLLAHSHNFSKKDLIEKIRNHIVKNDRQYVTKPIEMPDLICIADACCWVGTKSLTPHSDYQHREIGECIKTEYWCEQREFTYLKPEEVRSPIATAIKNVIYRLSKEHEGLRSLAFYFKNSFTDIGGGFCRYWPIKEVFSEHNIKKFKEIGRHPDYKFPDEVNY